MPPGSFKRVTGTLRFRLTVWNTLVVLLLLLLCLLAVRAGLRLTLFQLLNEFLEEEMVTAAGVARRLYDRPAQLHADLDHQARAHPRRQLFVQIFNQAGQLVWSSEHTPAVPLELESLRAISSPLDLGDHRVLQRRLTFPEASPMILRVGCAEFGTAARLARMTDKIVLICSVMVFLIPLGAYWLARRVTKPLAHIIETTEGLHPANLQERLPLRGTHDELDHLAVTINGFLDRIAGYLAQNRDFTANVAHELRSPLAAIQSSLELALNTDRSVEDYKEFLVGLLEDCGHLRTLINQLLLLAEGDAGLLLPRSEAVRLDDVVLRSVDMFQVVGEAAEVKLDVGRLEPVVVLGDSQRLWQVVNNLLDNAIKFTPPGGAVTLELKREGAGKCVLTVADTGSGIAPDDLPHVFERFFQADKSRHRDSGHRGTGLGLSICKTIITAHGGAIEVASTPGRGTTITVTFTGCTLLSDSLVSVASALDIAAKSHNVHGR